MDEPTRVEAPATSASRTVMLIRRVVRPIWMLTGVAGVLEVSGRRGGAARHVTLAPIKVDGSRYLVSRYRLTGLLRNLLAAGPGELRGTGRSERCPAVEVADEECVGVVAAPHACSRGRP